MLLFCAVMGEPLAAAVYAIGRPDPVRLQTAHHRAGAHPRAGAGAAGVEPHLPLRPDRGRPPRRSPGPAGAVPGHGRALQQALPPLVLHHAGAHSGAAGEPARPGVPHRRPGEAPPRASVSGSSPRAASPATSSPAPARPAPPAWPSGAGRPVVPIGIWGSQRVKAPGHESSYRLRLPIYTAIGPPLLVAEDEDIHEATDRIMTAICAAVAEARTGYPGPRRGEDPWWVRAPETAQLRSCRRPSRRRRMRGGAGARGRRRAGAAAGRGRARHRRRVRGDSRRGDRRWPSMRRRSSSNSGRSRSSATCRPGPWRRWPPSSSSSITRGAT